MPRSTTLLLVASLCMVGCHAQVRPSPKLTPPPAQPRAATKPVSEVPLAILLDERPPPLGSRLNCTVCGDEFEVTEQLPMRHYRGKVVLFCCQRCLPHFDGAPETFVNQKP